MAEARSLNYSFERVDEGVHAAICRPDGLGISNAGLVDLGGETLVFDTTMTPSTAGELRGAAEVLLARPVSIVANSHRHLDHILGNQVFSNLPIWGTRRTREVLLERQDRLMAELTREGIEREIQELEGRRETMRNEGARADLEFNLRCDRALLPELGNLKITPPDHTFEDRQTLPGDRGAKLISFGSGHTEADALLFLPDDGVLFAGDLVVVGQQPSLGSGDPFHWLVVLDELERLGPEQIVPGHGPLVDADGLQETRDYLSGVITAAGSPPGAGLPRALQPWESSVSLEENLRSARAFITARGNRP